MIKVNTQERAVFMVLISCIVIFMVGGLLERPQLIRYEADVIGRDNETIIGYVSTAKTAIGDVPLLSFHKPSEHMNVLYSEKDGIAIVQSDFRSPIFVDGVLENVIPIFSLGIRKLETFEWIHMVANLSVLLWTYTMLSTGGYINEAKFYRSFGFSVPSELQFA